MRDNTTTTPVDLSEREHASLERYAQDRGLTVDEAATELAQSVTARRIGPSIQVNARVIQLRRVR